MIERHKTAVEVAQSCGALATDYFRKLATLEIVDKGLQDFVSEADQNVELHARALIEAAFPDDGIIGEEHAPKPSKTGYNWVIDPIDGTTNFVNAIPAWTVVLAVVKDDRAEIGVILDPLHDELFSASLGHGAKLNNQTLICPADTQINRGSIGTGYCSRSGKDQTIKMIEEIIRQDGMFHRNASGALSLAYTAAGRLIGFVEEHMNAWDCLAGQLIVSEAGGRVEQQSADAMIQNGGRVVAGSAAIFDELVRIADTSFGD